MAQADAARGACAVANTVGTTHSSRGKRERAQVYAPTQLELFKKFALAISKKGRA
ncbi:hypothetical protein PAMC26577_35885 [Caballeronia sordidicola]|uniref:Uncharacterized protein n=1 Tax=Caballeronia sordidicola TaxID=196367 RepID=A0A242M922_CABSO|nr:hypothetical protein PAMC26577_35885 [Caballeronia sordidicola]